VSLLRNVSVTADAARFLAAGGVNTVLSVGIYQIALFAVSPGLAYSIAWVSGIGFLIVVYPEHVFIGGRRGAYDRVLLAACYVAVFAAGFSLLGKLVIVTGAPRLAIIVTVTSTTVLNFVLSRSILRRRANDWSPKKSDVRLCRNLDGHGVPK
jgi:putative flippase GtrA